MENIEMFIDVRVANGTIHAKLNPAMAGYNFEYEILPRAMEYLKNKTGAIDFVLEDASGQKIVTFDKTDAKQEILEKAEEKLEELEGEKEEEKEEEVDFGEDFTTFEEIEEAFKGFADSTSGIDLTKDENSNYDVMAMCEKMLSTVMRCTHYDFTDEEIEKVSKYLEYAGYRDYAETNDKYKEFDRQDGVEKEEITLENASQTRGSLYLPLTILGGFVNKDKATFNENLAKLRPGGEYRKYVVSWYKTQELDRDRNMMIEDEYIHIRKYTPINPMN